MGFKSVWINSFFDALNPLLDFIDANIQSVRQDSDRLIPLALHRANDLLTVHKQYDTLGWLRAYQYGTPECIDKMVFNQPQMHNYQQFIPVNIVLPGMLKFVPEKFDLDNLESDQERYLLKYCTFLEEFTFYLVDYLDSYRNINHSSKAELRVQCLNAIDHFVHTIDV